MLHEFAHSFGFGDEYSYNRHEAELYCGRPGVSGPNYYAGIGIEDWYASKQEALIAYQTRIPWCKRAIDNGTQVVQEQKRGNQLGYKIGTPSPIKCPDLKLGIYWGGNCQKKWPKTFRPYFCSTIMGTPMLDVGTCDILWRNRFYSKIPNLLPSYYRDVIAKDIIRKTGRKMPAVLPGGSQIGDPRDVTGQCEFHYGVPKIDHLDDIIPATEKADCTRFDK